MRSWLSEWYKPVPRESPDGSNVNPRIDSNGQPFGRLLNRDGVYAKIAKREWFSFGLGRRADCGGREQPLSSNVGGRYGSEPDIRRGGFLRGVAEEISTAQAAVAPHP